MRTLRTSCVALLGAMAASAQAPPADPRPPQRDGAAAWQRVVDAQAAWQRDHHGLVTALELGKSVEGRPLLLLRIGAQQDGQPEVYLGSGIHGHEGSEDDARWMIDQLLARRNEPHVAELLATRVLWVQLAMNPDGIAAATRKNARGVDLNRNFAVRWEKSEPAARTYAGPEPFSEPETAALRDFALARPHLRAWLDLHRSTDLLVEARAHDGTLPADVDRAAAALAAAMGDFRRWGVGSPAPTPGGLTIDWVWQEAGVVAFTIENESAGGSPPDRDPRWLALLHLLEHAADYPHSRRAAADEFAPQDVTDATKADARELARLQAPGTVLFADDFESAASRARYFELGGDDEGRVQWTADPALAHTGHGALSLLAADRGGRSCGANASRWLDDAGRDVVHLRYWIRYAADYDQGNLNHTGGSLCAITGTDKWGGMGTAGLRPLGDDAFDSRVEGWVDWQKAPPPGWLMCYAYWMDMKRDRDGHFWGNLLGPAAAARVVPQRDRWLCVEQRIAANTPGKADGELAVWLDGALYLHQRGIRWRSSDAVKIKRATLMVYVHQSRRDNRVFYDDVVVSTGYVGTGAVAATK
jgi:hypothetical protein